MEYHLLDFGEISVTSETMLRGTGEAMVWVPVKGVLFSDGDKHVVYDAGCGGGFAPAGMPARRDVRQTMKMQLALHGLAPEDISAVVISHLHDDHFGGMEIFDSQPVYLPGEELRDFNRSLPKLDYRPIWLGDERELLPGLRLLTLPGHTKNLLGLKMDANGQKLLFVSDAVYTPIHLGPPIRYSGYPWNDAAYEKSVERLQRMIADGYEIIWNHWPIPELQVPSKD